MAQDRVNPLSNLSYVNKDFQSVYVELLDLVKELSYRWDPTISNESDPGVILLKLNALIADKCNYNIDKNVLECFPLSVTQDANARQLYEQLGYYMHWYRGAETDISLKWIGDIGTATYTIPAFSMVCDYDNSVIYTLIGPSNNLSKGEFNVGSQKINTDGSTITTFKSIQGIAVKYEINNDPLITVANLDSNNRLYFDTTDVAENGIFITNVGLNNYSSWERKDNLLVQETGNTFYKFGLSRDGMSCYLEFPEDAETIFREGINITYVRTMGSSGNVAANIIEKFYADIIPDEAANSENNNIILNADNVRIQNVNAAVNGEDPESLDDAYRNYKRQVGTFTTLVTLRDYTNAILNSGLVSNCFATDRTNDVQSTYEIMGAVDTLSQTINTIESENDQPLLTAFSLKLYLLQYVEAPTTIESFDKTFDIIGPSATENIKAYIEDQKSMQHDYVDLLPCKNEIGKSHFCYFKNKYPLNIRVTTQYQLTNAEALDLIANVRTALFNELNAKEIEFGEEISLDLVYDIVQRADTRIKTIAVDNINYTTYAVVYDGSKFIEVAINNEDIFDITSSNEALEVTVDQNVYESKMGYGEYLSTHFVYDADSTSWILIQGEQQTTVNLEDYGITVNGTPETNDTLDIAFTLAAQFRDEIFAKSVLAGVTQLFVKEESFDYKLNQSVTQVIDNIERIGGECVIHLDQDNAEYTLRANENIQFYAPNLIDSDSYSDYVKYEYYITNNVTANSNYQLRSNEYIILYWKTSDEENSVYKYYAYGEGNIFSPSFDMPAKESASDIIGSSLAVKDSTLRNIGTTNEPKWVGDSSYNGDMSTVLSDAIFEMTANSNVLTGTKKINIKQLNQLTLDSTDYYCYWILNDATDDKYTLFKGNPAGEEPQESSHMRVLHSGEYFIYSNSALTDLIILGAGTELIRQDNNGSPITENDWSVNITDSTNITQNGAAALANYWFKIPSNATIKLTENQYTNLGGGASLRLESSQGQWSLDLNKDPSTPLSDFTIFYKGINDEAYTKLEDVSLASHASWRARTMLALNVTSSDEQILYKGHTIYYYLKDSDTPEVIQGEDEADGKYPVVLLSSLPINDVSGEIIETVVTDQYGNDEYLSLYEFAQTIETDEVWYSSEGSAILNFRHKQDVETKSFQFSLPKGNYIIPLTNAREDLVRLEVNCDGTPMKSMNTNITNFRQKGSYYLQLDIEEEVEHTISVTVSGHQEPIVITLTNPYRYTKPEGMEQWKFEKYKELISDLDPNHLFNYANDIPEDDEIEDPLSGASFMLPNHIFNDFTICQMDTTANSSIYVVGKK